MRYLVAAETDKGDYKAINQDSVLVRHGMAGDTEVLMAIVCDGMGGLDLGELASAAVIKEFDKWFDESLPYEFENLAMNIIGAKWALMLKEANVCISDYAKRNELMLGTTFTGILFVGSQYVVAHVGDSRLYLIDDDIAQLTKDHTFIARELRKGTMTLEEAMKDKRRNLLLQCVGASEKIEPEVFMGRVHEACYMLCSDGLRHKVTEDELHKAFAYEDMTDKKVMSSSCKKIITLNRERKEKDNISVILIKAFED